jgi:hypothetical protein
MSDGEYRWNDAPLTPTLLFFALLDDRSSRAFSCFQREKPTLGPAKSYCIDIRGKISAKIFLTFRQQSGTVGRFMHLASLRD